MFIRFDRICKRDRQIDTAWWHRPFLYRIAWQKLVQDITVLFQIWLQVSLDLKQSCFYFACCHNFTDYKTATSECWVYVTRTEADDYKWSSQRCWQDNTQSMSGSYEQILSSDYARTPCVAQATLKTAPRCTLSFQPVHDDNDSNNLCFIFSYIFTLVFMRLKNEDDDDNNISNTILTQRWYTSLLTLSPNNQTSSRPSIYS